VTVRFHIRCCVPSAGAVPTAVSTVPGGTAGNSPQSKAVSPCVSLEQMRSCVLGEQLDQAAVADAGCRAWCCRQTIRSVLRTGNERGTSRGMALKIQLKLSDDLQVCTFVGTPRLPRVVGLHPGDSNPHPGNPTHRLGELHPGGGAPRWTRGHCSVPAGFGVPPAHVAPLFVTGGGAGLAVLAVLAACAWGGCGCGATVSAGYERGRDVRDGGESVRISEIARRREARQRSQRNTSCQQLRTIFHINAQSGRTPHAPTVNTVNTGHTVARPPAKKGAPRKGSVSGSIGGWRSGVVPPGREQV
jgi:hypothetical protein